MNIGERIDSAGDWIRARTNRYQSVARETADPPGVTVLQWQVNAAKTASWIAFGIAAFFMGAYCLEVAGDRAAAMHVTHAGTWTGELLFYIPLLIGFLALSIGIPYLAKNIIAIFVALNWREHFWPKLWCLVLAIGVSCAIILGSFSTMGGAIVERGRESAVAVEQVAQQGAVMTARIDDLQHRLNEMTRSESQYIRTAASMSPEAYDRFVEARRDDWQYDRLKSYRETSVDAERLRNQMSELRAQQATATVTAAVTASPETAETGWVIDLLAWVRGAWAIVLAVLNDLACLFMGLIALRLEQARARQMAEIGAEAITNEGFMIEDLRDDDPGPIQPLEPIKEVMKDVATGEEIKYAQVPAHMRRIVPRKKKKGEPIEVNVAGVAVEERNRTTDGGARTGFTAEQIAAQMQPGNVLARAVDRPVLDGAFEQQQANTDSAQDHDVRDHVGLHDDGGRKAEEQATSEDNADGHNGIARDALQTIHTPDSTPASPEREAPIFSADEMSAFDEAPLGLGEDGRDGVVVRERELEGAK